ncbi:HTH-type transcriptional repressor FabR [Polyangium aurulentum]|uniref:HTH-type transcriptional repressor FabR n=1 Tax=Polyangium aurulentum TaxID=2567896 RepID=UPI0010AE239A|nr:HTH-type transcriptional repressor FabR [Polyangium aurulentum]UQA60184.1 HTH-type transcriptional repressor FabR [Polyangium aurulentum]
MRRPRQPSDERVARAEQKQLTRQALLAAALELLAERSFDGLSLREVTRQAGVVPTAFYRHFESMEELGLVLVDDAFRTMRRLMRTVREGPIPPSQAIRRSVETFVQYVLAHRPHFTFLLRERFGGSTPIRNAIRAGIRLFVTDLAADLASVTEAAGWTQEDLQMLAGLLVSTVVTATEQVIEIATSPAGVEEVVQDTERQLRLIVLGAMQWRSSPRPDLDTGKAPTRL